MDSHDWVFDAAKTAGQPQAGLIFDVPEFRGSCHDYEPHWDYIVDESPDPTLFKMAQAAAKAIYQRTQTPFECWAVKFTDEQDQRNAGGCVLIGAYPSR